jgi:hypothetical protein
MLAFFTRALPSGCAFSRRLYALSYKNIKTKLTGGMKKDLQIWKAFLNNYNGCSYIRELKIGFQIMTSSYSRIVDMDTLWAVLHICMERGPF